MKKSENKHVKKIKLIAHSFCYSSLILLCILMVYLMACHKIDVIIVFIITLTTFFGIVYPIHRWLTKRYKIICPMCGCKLKKHYKGSSANFNFYVYRCSKCRFESSTELF